MVELDDADDAATPERVWERVRRADLGVSPFVRALFAIRTLPGLVAGADVGAPSLRLDDLTSAPRWGPTHAVEAGRRSSAAPRTAP